ncbi:CRISPR/Cas system-associated RAMP superfamily protein Cas6e [Kitasatospora sp. Ki12]
MFEALTEGRSVRYRLAGNPVHRLPDPAHKAGYRLAALTGTAALNWWHTRARAVGLDLTHTIMSPGRYNTSRAKPGLCHALVHFDGTATITDPHRLTDAIRTGIGRGKAYGAGLLSLAPA